VEHQNRLAAAFVKVVIADAIEVEEAAFEGVEMRDWGSGTRD
jgi:hypothetical protein